MHGFNQGESLLSELITSHDIVCVQEHWLFTDDLCKFNAIAPNFISYGISSMDNNLMSDFLKGRPFGGLTILVHDKFCKIAYLLHKCENYIVIKFGNIIICNVYLPCNDPDFYKCILQDISSYLLKYRSNSIFMICGVFNSNFTNSCKLWPSLQQFIKFNNLCITDSKLSHVCPPYTYQHMSLGQKSFLTTS